MKSLRLLWASFLSVHLDTSLGNEAQTKGPDTGITGSSQPLDSSDSLVGQLFCTMLHSMDAHMDIRYWERPKHEATVKAVPPCWTVWGRGLHRVAQPLTTTQGCSPCHPLCSWWQITAAVAPQRHLGQGSSGVVGGLCVSLKHRVKLVWSAWTQPFPASPQPSLGGHSQEGFGTAWRGKAGGFALFLSQEVGVFLLFNGLVISATHAAINDVLRIYHLFLQTL